MSAIVVSDCSKFARTRRVHFFSLFRSLLKNTTLIDVENPDLVRSVTLSQRSAGSLRTLRVLRSLNSRKKRKP